MIAAPSSIGVCDASHGNDPFAFVCASELANQVAVRSSLTAEEVLYGLTFLPENLLMLLSSPEGWTALAQFVAASLGPSAFDFDVTVH